jgi:sodium transport system permease protein
LSGGAEGRYDEAAGARVLNRISTIAAGRPRALRQPPEGCMRWSIIRLIWFRELRDQLRDRRTILMVAVLPLLLYPLLGLGVSQIAVGLSGRPMVVGVFGSDHLPPVTPHCAGLDPLGPAAWLTLAPDAAGESGGLARVAGAAALARVADRGLGQDYPPLVLPGTDGLRFPTVYLASPDDARAPQVRALPWPEGQAIVPGPGADPEAWLKPFKGPLERREVLVLLVVPGDFLTQLNRGQRPEVYVLAREDDERSRRASNQVQEVLDRWGRRLAQVRLLRHGLPSDYGEGIAVLEPDQGRPAAEQAARRLVETLIRVFPFLLVMWALTGALYPAVDLCAGEKERGTMETLLISPASREEIVYGKFLTIWVFSGSTALLNLLSMGATSAALVVLSKQPPVAVVRPAAVVWCVLLALPLSAFFSAVCLSIGAYARSSKEGQYYLMPLFLLTMPLIFLTLVPGVQLNAFYAMVPITGVALLLQHLLTTPIEGVKWAYFGPVLAPVVISGWLALRWAVSQFQREEVLFREAERLDLGLWLRRLFREKEPLPSAGQALFCFGLIVGLRWLSLGLGAGLAPVAHAAVDLVAFVVAPPLLMVLLLTTRPRYGVGLRLPPPQAWGSAALLVLLLVLPLADLSTFLLTSFPTLKTRLTETTALAEMLAAVSHGALPPGSQWQLVLVLVLLAPVCEELAFRGFVLTGLRQRFHPWTAILLSSLLFAVSHLNVFQFLPMFVLGVILGMIATRSRSVLPGTLLHVLYNGLVVAPLFFPGWAGALGRTLESPPSLRPVVVTLSAVLAAGYLAWTGYRLWATGRSPWWDELPSQAALPPGPGPDRDGAVLTGRTPDREALS